MIMQNVGSVKMSSLDQSIIRRFHKPLFADLDRRFLIILIACILMQTAGLVFLARRPLVMYTQKEIIRTQESYVRFLGLDVIPQVPDENAVKELTSSMNGESAAAAEENPAEGAEGGEAGREGGGSGGEGSGPGDGESGSGRESEAEVRQAARMASAGAMREAISREVSDKGILRQLTGTGSAVSGVAVANPFTGAGGPGTVGEDLDPILSSAGGLKTRGESGLGGGTGSGIGVRGERAGQKAGIDDMVEGLESAGGGSLTRKGELKIETTADVAGLGRKSIYRSAEAIYQVIYEHRLAIQHCYERELKRYPDLKGKIKVSITIGPDGAVKDTSILESTLSNERVERCILSRIKLWNDFTPIEGNEGDVTVIQLFTFGY